MLHQEPLMHRLPPSLKVFLLFLIVLVSALISYFTGVLLAKPFFGVSAIDVLTSGNLPESFQEISLLKFMQVLNQIGTFVIPSFVFAFLVSYSMKDYLGIERVPGLFSALSVIMLMYLLLPLIHELARINQALELPGILQGIETWMRDAEIRAEELTKTFLKTTSVWGLIINLLIVGVLASVGEELLFRSVLIKVFSNLFGNVHVAVLVSAILFSAFHMQFFTFLPRFFLGLLFGYLFIWSGSVWLPILAHFINNASAVVVYFLINKGVVGGSLEEFGAADNMMLLLISMVLSVVLLVFVFMNEKNGLAFLRKNRFLQD